MHRNHHKLLFSLKSRTVNLLLSQFKLPSFVFLFKFSDVKLLLRHIKRTSSGFSLTSSSVKLFLLHNRSVNCEKYLSPCRLVHPLSIILISLTAFLSVWFSAPSLSLSKLSATYCLNASSGKFVASIATASSSACALAPLPFSGSVPGSAANAPTGRTDSIIHAASAALRSLVLFFLMFSSPFRLLFCRHPPQKAPSAF